jgi:broad specificity phosphatase PhoE
VLSTRFVLVRHAESLWNASGRWQGHGDPELSARGREQAAEVAAELAHEPLDRLICSDLRRAVQTAEIIGAPHGLKPQPDARFRELDVGRWTGLTRSQIEALDPELLQRFEQEEPDLRAGGGESRRQMRRRVRGAIEALAAERAGETVALVVHLGVIRAALGGVEADHVEVRRATAEQIIQAMRRRG